MIFDTFLGDRNLPEADGRPLHAYECEDGEYKQFTELLKFRVASSEIFNSTAQWFVLWASEHLRRTYAGKPLAWEMVFSGLGLDYDWNTATEMTELGLKLWKRPLRKRDSDGSRQFIFSLLVEGGLPNGLLARDSGYSTAVLETISELGASPISDFNTAIRIAQRRIKSLPTIFHNEDSAWLLAELSLSFVNLRAELPSGLNDEAAEIWLERHRPGWKQELPLRLSEDARRLILQPALSEKIQRRSTVGPLTHRCLYRQGESWTGAVRIKNGGILPFEAAPLIDDRSLVLRLVADSGENFRAVPDETGWRLSTSKGTDQSVDLEPSQACIFSAHADGRLLSDIVLDAGLPNCDEAPSLWRAENSNIDEPDVLLPASSPRTKGKYIWALLPPKIKPESDNHVSIGRVQNGPNGQLWPLSGSGRVRLGNEDISIETESDTEDIEVRIVLIGQPLRHWHSPEGLTVFCGGIRTLVGIGDKPLHDVSRTIRKHPIPNKLEATVYEWVSKDGLRVRTRCVTLPDKAVLSVREIHSGVVELNVSDLPPGLIIKLTAAETEEKTQLDASGMVKLQLDTNGRNADRLELILYDPTSGNRLKLARPWPVRDPILIDPNGDRLKANRDVSLATLSRGWRGILPEMGGDLLVSIAGKGSPVAFKAQGPQRLAVYHDLISQILALAGADGRVNLQLVSRGHTPRLEIGRYDWEPQKIENYVNANDGETSFNAISLSEKVECRETEVTGILHLDEWLGDTQDTWLVQGQSANGFMRPLVWSKEPFKTHSRQERIDAYAERFKELMQDSRHTDWRMFPKLIQGARRGGDCGALDQVQALSDVPALAIALLFVVEEQLVPEMLELEIETPLWLPLTHVDDWHQALKFCKKMRVTQLEMASFEKDEAIELTEKQTNRRLESIIKYRAELSGHIGVAMSSLSMEPVTLADDGTKNPLLPPNPEQLLNHLAQELAARSPDVPQGARGLLLTKLSPPGRLSEHLQPLLIAPFVVAEVAAGITPYPEPEDTLKLMALRYADPTWFDLALPLALNVAMQHQG